MKNKGFSLVELIVVIAIMAILVGVAVPVYTSYIEKAQKAKDVQLIDEVEHALQIAYASGSLTQDGYIVLSSADGVAPNYNGNEEIVAVMEATFGSDWKNKLALSYTGWVGMTSDKTFADAYKGSSFNGNEGALITQLGSVTTTLQDALAANSSLVGNSFNAFLTENKIDTTDNQAVSNAAVLYAAETIGEMDATKTQAVNDAFAAFYTPDTSTYGNIATLTTTLKDQLGTFGAVAAIYAHGEAFGQYVAANGNTDLLNDFHDIDISGVENTDDALTQVANNLGTLVNKAQTDETINPFALQYIAENQYAADVTAYLEAMKKINANADKFSDKLASAGCYTDGTASSLLQAAVAAGSMNVSCNNGEVVIWISGGVSGNTVTGIQD